jgi:hypothetical protein
MEALKRKNEKAAADKAAAEAAAPAPRLRDVDALLGAIHDIPLYYSGESERQPLAPIYNDIVRAALQAMQDKSREALLVWPHADPAPALIAVALSLADCASSRPIKSGSYDARAAPVGMRALIYPYTRNERHALRTILVDRTYVASVQLAHQMRLKPGDDPALGDFHRTLARVGSLRGLGKDGQPYPEFNHPCADELVPTSRINQPDSMAGLLWRVRTKTDLSRFDRPTPPPAEQPNEAAFYLFGVHADDNPADALAAVRAPLDLALVDLTRTGTQRLDREWLARTKAFFAELDQKHPRTATLVLTDDPWTFDTVRRDLLLSKKQKREKQAPPPGAVVLAHSPALLGGTSEAPVYADVSAFEISPYAGSLDEVSSLAGRLARRAIEMGDIPAAENIYEIVGTLRRCAALPAPLPSLADFVASEIGERGAAERLSNYSTNAPLNELQKSRGALSQHEGPALGDFDRRVRLVQENAAQLTPMATEFEATLAALMGKSSRTAILFRDNMLADFAAETFAALPDFRDLDRRFATKMMYFVDAGELDDLAREPPSYRKQFKTLVIVGLSRQVLLSALARPWLPERVVIIGDTATLSGAARDVKRLLRYDALGPLRPRLEKFAARAAEEVGRQLGMTLVLDDDATAPDDTEKVASGVLNLAGEATLGQPLYRFELDTGEILIAKPGTQLVLQNTARLVPTFYQESASNVERGDHICVIGDAFLAMARPLLNITVRAAEEIRDYHRLVLKQLASIPAATPTQRLTEVIRRMTEAGANTSNARYWVDIEGELDKPLEEIVPHAPREHVTYLAFMKALGVSDTHAEHYWIWAVIAQRALRVRAALRYHDAYRAILVSPHAAQADNPQRAKDIKRIRSAAESFVGRVLVKTKIGGAHARP